MEILLICLSSFRKLIEAGADASLFSDDLGMSPLHYAVFAGSADKVRVLLETDGNRADVDAQTLDGAQSPLHLAAEAGHAEVLDVLLESLANINARDAFGVTPLFVAAREGHEACVVALLAAGSDLHFRGGSDNRSVTEVH
jgi:ankyrin repeat protein